MRVHRLRRSAVALATVAVGMAASAPAGSAAPVPWGQVLVWGPAWAGASATRGDTNVYSNGDGQQDVQGAYGWDYECVELAQRWANVRFGEQPIWPVSYAYQMWNVGPTLKVPFLQLPNGGSSAPQFGDLIVFNQASNAPYGHVAVVSGVTSTQVSIVEQNWDDLNNPTGQAVLPIQGTTMAPRFGITIQGWLRASNSPDGVTGGQGPGGYTVDGYGGIHGWGSALPPQQIPGWPGWDIVRGIVRLPTPAGAKVSPDGYILDGWGGVHPFGNAPGLGISAYWRGWDIARGIALRPDGLGGYVLDGWGGLHQFGNAPPLGDQTNSGHYWPGFDIARGVVLRKDGVSGYVLDGWGGVHPFGGAPGPGDPSGHYWKGYDIARGITVTSDGTGGYVLDGWDGVHPFGTATGPSAQPPSFPGQDVARGIVSSANGGGFTVLNDGTVEHWGSAAPVYYDGGFAYPVGRGITN